MTQTNKPLVFLRLTPVLLPVVLLASVFMITACGGKKSGALPTFTPPPPPPTFTSRVIDDVPADIQSQIAVISAEADAIKDLQFLRLGENYLREISFNIPRGADVQTLTLKGENGGGGLDERAGFLMTFVADSTENYAHSVVGLFETNRCWPCFGRNNDKGDFYGSIYPPIPRVPAPQLPKYETRPH